MTTDKDNILHDIHAAALAEAAALRVLHKYREARQSAVDRGAESGTLQPEPPDYTAISSAYAAIIDEWLDQPIENSNVAVCALDLLAQIASDQRIDNILYASADKEQAEMLRLIAQLREWVNELTLNSYVETVRAAAVIDKVA